MSDSHAVPPARLRALVDRPPAPDRGFVLYWMTSARRLGWSYALDRAVELARELRRPLVVLEPLRCDYRWASDRLHAFVLEGMAANARRAAKRPILHYPYVESARGEGKGLLAALASCAAAVVADDYPCFFLPRMLGAAARQVDCRLEAVDSNGLLPLAAADREFATAHSFRRFLQSSLRGELLRPPSADPLAGARLPRLERLPAEIVARWPPATAALLGAERAALAELPIDHRITPVDVLPGGSDAAGLRLAEFVASRLERYDTERNDPDADGASGLSPYLHFGHLSAHQALAAVAERHGWSAETVPSRGDGRRAGWWGLPAGAEALLDQLVTWRELGFHGCARRPAEYDRFESLPAWARTTLERHRGDRRPWRYELDQLEAAATHDPLWNAAQRQLAVEGRIQNYLRMLWGKKIVEWSADPRAALEAMIVLNDRYALDGRDPNSYSGIGWCLGKYDRPWGPERPIFGTVRYMSSENTRRKLRVASYLERWSSGAGERR